MTTIPEISLVDLNSELVSEWRRRIDFARVAEEDIFATMADAVVSPANSFGFMDGGIDLAYSEEFGWEVEETLQEIIRNHFDGELLVGQAVIVPTGHPRFRYLIAAPTMRVPMSILDPAAVRLATRAALRVAVKAGLKSIRFPGMGTGTGLVRAPWAAEMMKAGFLDVMDQRPFPHSLKVALHHHELPGKLAVREGPQWGDVIEKEDGETASLGQEKPATLR